MKYQAGKWYYVEYGTKVYRTLVVATSTSGELAIGKLLWEDKPDHFWQTILLGQGGILGSKAAEVEVPESEWPRLKHKQKPWLLRTLRRLWRITRRR